MKNVSFVARALDRLGSKRHPQRLASTRPMSDRELALALREIFQRNAAAERKKQIRTPAMAELRLLGRSVKEQDARTMDRSGDALTKAIKMLRDPAPDTFLGRKTQAPFPNMDVP